MNKIQLLDVGRAFDNAYNSQWVKLMLAALISQSRKLLFLSIIGGISLKATASSDGRSNCNNS